MNYALLSKHIRARAKANGRSWFIAAKPKKACGHRVWLTKNNKCAICAERKEKPNA